MRVSHQTLVLALAMVGLWPGIASAEGDPARGQSLFKQNCAGCHGKDGRGGAHTFMPHVDTLTRKGYIEQVPDDYLAFVIAEGGVAVGKSSYMPSWKSKLNEQDIQDVIAYIRTLETY